MGAKSFHNKVQIHISKCVLSLNSLYDTYWLIGILNKLLQCIEMINAEDTSVVLKFRVPTDFSNVAYIISA